MKATTPEVWLSNLPDEVKIFALHLLELQDAPLQLARYAQALKKAAPSKISAAEVLAENARRMGGCDVRVRLATEWLFRSRVPRWHFSLLHDATRNSIYHEALRRHVRPGMIVLEIGAGSGILAMLAAKCGARHVYACEMEPFLADAARENVARNGLSDRVTILTKSSWQLEVGADLPERADLLVSEIVDNDLLGEGVLPIMADAWERLLRPGAIVLPAQIEIRGALVGGAPWTRSFRAPSWDGLDLSALELAAPVKTPLHDATNACLDDALSDDLTMLKFDLSAPLSHLPETREMSVSARRDGWVDAFVHWLVLRFDKDLVLTNRPPLASVWRPVVHGFPSAIPVRAGEQVHLEMRHDLRSTMIRPI